MTTDTPIRDKTLPHNLEAERTVLGAVLVDNAAFNSAAEILTRDDFYRESHRRIFEGMAALAEKSQPIDLVTLKDELARGSALEAVGGASYRAGLVDGVPRLTSVEHWSRIIKERAVLRNLIHASNRIAQSCYEAEEDAAAVILDRAEKAIFDIAERRIRQGFVGIRDIVKESFRTIDQLSQSRELVTGLPTGFVLATKPFWGRRAALTVVNTALAFPTVVVGLLVYGLLSRRGPLGGLGWLYTWQAIVIADVLLAFPIAAALSAAAVHGVDPRIRRTAETLGAGPWRTAWAVAREARHTLRLVP